MYYILWIALAVGFLAVEFGTVALISLWFVIGALAAMVADLLGAVLWLQILIFALVSLAMLLLVRPFLRRYVNPYKTPTNADALLGQEAIVTEAINNLEGTGAVKLGGLTWTARAEDGAPIPEGAVVVVRAIDGVKAIVTPRVR